MRSFIVSALFLFAFTTFGFGPDLPDNFRGNKWGSSIDQVKKYEKVKLDFIRAGLKGLTEFDGIPVHVRYSFHNNALFQGTYVYSIPYNKVTQQSCLDIYRKFKSYLTGKYGNPFVDNKWVPVFKSKKAYDFSENNQEKGFYNGYLEVESEWMNNVTRLKLLAYKIKDRSGNYFFNTLVMYNDDSIGRSILFKGTKK